MYIFSRYSSQIVNMYILSRYASRIVKRMGSRGYFFNTLESRKGWLRFYEPGGRVITFPTWKEVELWMKGVVRK